MFNLNTGASDRKNTDRSLIKSIEKNTGGSINV
jgi:hypothetical protein